MTSLMSSLVCKLWSSYIFIWKQHEQVIRFQYFIHSGCLQKCQHLMPICRDMINKLALWENNSMPISTLTYKGNFLGTATHSFDSRMVKFLLLYISKELLICWIEWTDPQHLSWCWHFTVHIYKVQIIQRYIW